MQTSVFKGESVFQVIWKLFFLLLLLLIWKLFLKMVDGSGNIQSGEDADSIQPFKG